MPRCLSDDEQAFRKHMSVSYKEQEGEEDGYDDWGEYTAHVAHEYHLEIIRLRDKLRHHGVDPGPWDSPLPDV